jgi:Kef-type K+ transport system membrane component KefB
VNRRDPSGEVFLTRVFVSPSMSQLSPHEVTVMFLATGVLLITARMLGELMQRFGQPAVVGEILAGLLWGPTCLGTIAPAVTDVIFPSQGESAVVLEGLTTLSIAMFLLVAGMEVELSTMWRRGRTAFSVALAGFLVPFGLGTLAAWWKPYVLGCELDADPQIFALFFGTALSISALPVIAKTLMDLKLYKTELGMIVIGAAVFNDLVGWIVFAVILGMMGSGETPGYSIGGTVASTLLFAGFTLTIGRWLIRRMIPWLQTHTSWPGGVLGFSMGLALLGAALTEWIGVHAIFGSFLVGVAVGDSPHLRTETRRTIHNFVSFIFAPLFFASVGLRVNFIEKFDPLIVFSVLVIACLGKIAGCSLAARMTGMSSRLSWAIGFAMNARGAMEIILGLLALENGLIRQRMFVALVIMALVTSMASGPAISRLVRGSNSETED